MKRLIYIISIVFLVISVVSCEKKFELKLDSDNIIKVECFPGVADSIYVRVAPCISVNSKYNYSNFDPDVVLAVNGEDIPLKYDGKYYIADYDPSPGDEIRVKVSERGFDDVEAVTQVPIPIDNMKLETEVYDITQTKVVDQEEGPNLDLRLKVRLTVDDPAGSVDAYGIQFVRELIYTYESIYESGIDTSYNYSSGIVVDMQDNPLLPQTSTVFRTRFDGYTFNTYNSLTMFMDRSFNGKTHTLEVENRFQQDYSYSGEAYDQDGNPYDYSYSTKYRYKLRLYKMTSEFSRYAYAQHQIDENSFAEAGLAPAGYAYSNVTNGAGALAGVLMYETDWLEL